MFNYKLSNRTKGTSCIMVTQPDPFRISYAFMLMIKNQHFATISPSLLLYEALSIAGTSSLSGAVMMLGAQFTPILNIVPRGESRRMRHHGDNPL